MKTYLLGYFCSLFLLLTLSVPGKASCVDLAANYGLAGANTWHESTATDASGNIYLAGYFDGATLTIGSVTLTRIGIYDAFVAKLDASGAVLWAKNFGGSGARAYGNGIAADSSGNVYLGGYFRDANLTTPAFTKIGGEDAFALKLDPSGTILWAKNFGGSGSDVRGESIAVDSSGNAYIVGHTWGSLTTPAITRIGYRDTFAIKLDAAGTTIWAKNFGGSAGGCSALGKSIAVDNAGNVYLGGFFYDADFTTPALTRISTAAFTADAFAIKLDPAGTIAWAKNFGGNGARTYSESIAVDGSGNVYLGGQFSAANLTTPALTLLGGWNAFAIKLDAAGATTWAKSFGGSGANANAFSIAVDNSENVYLGGYFYTASLTTPALTKIGENDAYSLKLDPAGTILWAKNFGGSGASAYGKSIAVDDSGNVYLGGDFPNANLTTPALTKIGNWDTFIIRTSLYTLNFAANANGSVSGATSQTVSSGVSASTVTAVPDENYHFVNWTGTNGFATTTSNPLTVTNATSSMTITANFAIDNQNAPDLFIAVNGNGTVHTTPTPDLACTGGCNQNYPQGTLVTLVPSATTGSYFQSWTGCDSLAGNVCNVTMSTAKSVIATFATCSALIDTTCHGSAAAAYAVVNSNGIIKLPVNDFMESLNLNRSISFTIRGGYDPTFSSASWVTTIRGSITITAGTVTIENIAIM